MTVFVDTVLDVDPVFKDFDTGLTVPVFVDTPLG